MPAAEPVRRAAVLGHPIAHSLSPVLHLAAYRALGLAWEYDRIDVTGDRLASFVAGLDDSWVGLSLTMPLKEDVLPLLDEADDVVLATRAANTVVLSGGRRIGANTDVEGIVRTLADAGAGAGAVGTATVLGGGATARSALAALARIGATQVVAYVRRPEAGADLRRTGDALGLTVGLETWDDAVHGAGRVGRRVDGPARCGRPPGDRGPDHPGDPARRRLRPLAHAARRRLARRRWGGGLGA